MKNTLTLLIVLFSISVSAQLKNIRVGLGGNISLLPSSTTKKITNVHYPMYAAYAYHSPQGTIRESYKVLPGASLSGSFDLTVSRRFYFTSGLSISYLRFRKTTTIENIEGLSGMQIEFENIRPAPGSSVGQFYGYIVADPSDTEGFYRFKDLESDSKTGQSRILAVQFPVLVGTTFFKNRIGVKTGLVSSFIVGAETNDGLSSNNEMRKSTDRFNRASLGAMLQANYNLNRLLTVEVSGQHYFTPFNAEEFQTNGKMKMNVLSLGLTCKIRN